MSSSAQDKAPELASKARHRRESIESFVVIVVAFLVWSLEAEGFVIPTGSMAPTLMGRHKEMTCPECGLVYTVNADCEVEASGFGASTGLRVAWGTCQNCRFTTRVDELPSLSGDRIYTMKKGLSLPWIAGAGQVGPRRWDVTVFKLPEEPEVRYIKRLVGLPKETIRIREGDLWHRPDGSRSDFQRLRRPLDHQQATQVLVYDDAHRAKSLNGDARWRRWVPQDDGWSEPADGDFKSSSRGQGWTELRYRHIVPDPEQWDAIRAGLPVPTPPRPTLITDFSSYNTDLTTQGRAHPRQAARPWFQPHWVGDLTVSCRLTVGRSAGRFRIELIKAGASHRCEIDLATGPATLFRNQNQLGSPAHTSAADPGRHDLILANVDDRLTLWIDGTLPFGEGLPYRETEPETNASPTTADLEPVRIAAKAGDLEVSNLVLKRDLYYTREPGMADRAGLESVPYRGPRALFDLLADPAQYAATGMPPIRDFPLGPGRYLMLGDNSPWSRDGRAWSTHDQIDPDIPGRGWDASGRESWEVPESLIIGKAFCVYWPHFQPIWPNLKLGPDLRLPVRPSVEQIRWIR